MSDRPLTIRDVHKVLIPAMAGVFATRKDLDEYLARQERRLCAMMVEALKEGSIPSSHQLEEIDELEDF